MPWIELPHATKAYVRVCVDPGRRLVRLTRTTLLIPNDNVRELLTLFVNEMTRILPPGERPRQRLLFDIRDSPRLAGPNFESEVAGTFNQIMKDFERLAILLRTPIGVLQTRRLSRAGGYSAESFYDEAEALLYLTSTNKTAGDSQ